MARSLIGGLIARGHARRIHPRRRAGRRSCAKRCAPTSACQVFDDGTAAVARRIEPGCFAVKPQVMRSVCASLAGAGAGDSGRWSISIAAGITGSQLERWLGGGLPVVRAMPNTPALLGAGVTGLHASAQVDAAGRAFAEAPARQPPARRSGSRTKR